MCKRLVVGLSVVAFMFVLMAGPAVAQQPPPPHDHTLTVPGTGEVVQFGPPRCRLGETVDRAFLEVHFNVHVGEPATTGGLTVIPEFCP